MKFLFKQPIQAMLIRCSSITIEKYGTKPHKTEVAGKGQNFLLIEENFTKRIHATELDLLKITLLENRTEQQLDGKTDLMQQTDNNRLGF